MAFSIRSWKELNLAAQFAIAGGFVMVLSMVLIGKIVTTRIKDGVVRNTALATSQYMDSIVSPLAQDIAETDSLPPGASRALDEIFTNTPLGERVVSYKIWKAGGLIVHSNDLSLIGKRFDVDDNLAAALSGDIRAAFDKLDDQEDQGEGQLGLPLLEIYSPIREVWSGKVIGVAEFYEVATGLSLDLAAAQRRAWFAVGATFLSIGGLLYLIVLGGSRTIDQQRAALNRQLAELRALSAHNTALRQRVQNAAARSSAMNDQALRRIGADLHDGPAQLLSFAALRLDALRSQVTDTAELDGVERAVKDAIREVRSISKGLSLPDIDARDADEIIRGVAEAHEARTGAPVHLVCDLPKGTALSNPTKICLYRFVQEGLNNAWRYADGAGQEVRLTAEGGNLKLIVRDRGQGLVLDRDGLPKGRADDFSGIGLSGLRDRVESLGGTFTLRNREDGPGAEIGMELEMRFV